MLCCSFEVYRFIQKYLLEGLTYNKALEKARQHEHTLHEYNTNKAMTIKPSSTHLLHSVQVLIRSSCTLGARKHISQRNGTLCPVEPNKEVLEKINFPNLVLPPTGLVNEVYIKMRQWQMVGEDQNGRRMKEKESFLKNIPFITFEVNNCQIYINVSIVYKNESYQWY